MTRRSGSLLATGLAAAAAGGLASASTFRHDHFGSNAQDLGVYDQTIWGYSLVEVIPNTVTSPPVSNLLGDHFQPILIALGPLFWVWDDVRMLLLAQAALLALGSIPVFLWAREQLGTLAAVLFQVAYLGFWGLIGGNLYDFHDVAVATPIVSFALYALLTRRDLLLWATAALAFLTKENLALTIAAMGVYALVVQRRWRLGAALLAVSLPWFVFVLKVVIPGIAGRSYAHWEYPALGSGPGPALVHVVAHPIDTVRLFFSPETKVRALFNLFAPWLFLPLVSPLVIVMIPALAERFLSSRPEFWAQSFHYSLVLTPMLAFAAVDSTVRLRRLLGGRAPAPFSPALAAAMLLAGLFFTFGRTKPLDELERYTSRERIADIRACLDTIPPHASVSATSALVPHLSHRRTIYTLHGPDFRATQYLALDASTWIFPLTIPSLASMIDEARTRGYGIRCSRGVAIILQQGVRGGRLDPELRRLLTR